MAHLLLLKITDPKTGEYVIAKHITNNINDGTWPSVPWLNRHKTKKRLKKDILHFAVDHQDLYQAEYQVRNGCANDPLNKTDFIPPKIIVGPQSEETKRKRSVALKGRMFSPERKAKVSAAMKRGYLDGTRPVVISYHNADNVEKMSQKIKQNPFNTNRPKLQCQHCHKIVSINMYHRWHGDNCKNNW